MRDKQISSIIAVEEKTKRYTVQFELTVVQFANENSNPPL